MSEKKGYNRRDFLKIVGATTGMAAAGCASDVPEKIIPYVVQPDEIIPGVASWYAGNCSACSANCGVLVKTREGRAIKVEGNKSHPVNQGGLCSLGQSSLQELYDPDRVREPLLKDDSGALKPVSWEEALKHIAENISKSADKETALLSGTETGSFSSLVKEIAKKLPGFKHFEYDLLNNDAVELAAEKVFGRGVRTRYDFSKADVILGVGADYLETWNSPVENASSWAQFKSKRSQGKDTYVYQVEPRLSLTAANADKWIANAPGSEASVLLALLKLVVDSGKAKQANSLKQITSKLDFSELTKKSGLVLSELELISSKLLKAKSSLILAGGSACSSVDSVSCGAIANLLNIALGNIGKSVLIAGSTKKASSSIEELAVLTSKMEEGKVGSLIISGTNPAYSLTESFGFKKSLAKVGLIVSVSTELDETARFADVVLPLSTSFEAWSDSNPRPGVFNLNQPAMQPLYKSQSLGDTLISLLNKLDINLGEVSSYYDYIRLQWKKKIGAANFENKWLKLVENGGDWSKAEKGKSSFTLGSTALAYSLDMLTKKQDGISMMAYPSVKNFDGRAANRPWMQELPDPMTTVVWGSWVEVHPETAKGLGIKDGEVVQVLSDYGSLEAPIYENKYIHKDLVAVPIGQGRTSGSRYANGIGANPLKLLSPALHGALVSFVVSGVKLRKSVAKDELVTTQFSDSQKKRGIIRSVSKDELSEKKEKHEHSEEHGDSHGGGHHDPHVLGPRAEPKQMYKQMKHPQYKWGMSVDLNACTGCSACVVACYAENNVPVVGKEMCSQGREMSWIRIERYFDDDASADAPVEGFSPMMCQHCGHAPCEPVCPVYATYHNEEGLNHMVYNRCVGTRYCGNNCSYKVRRFNWFKYDLPEPLNWQLNPDVTVREVGVMEKCSFCVQRIREGKNNAKNEGREVADGEIQPACASSCPTKAIKFGNLLDHDSEVYQNSQDQRAYKVLDVELNTQPAISYLAKVKNDNSKH